MNPELFIIQQLLGTAREIRVSAASQELALLALKEEQSLMRRLEKVMGRAAADHPHGGTLMAEVGA